MNSLRERYSSLQEQARHRQALRLCVFWWINIQVLLQDIYCIHCKERGHPMCCAMLESSSREDKEDADSYE